MLKKFTSKEGYEIDYRLMFIDGRTKWVHERSYPIFEDGKVVRVAGYSSDITDKKTTEERLKVSEEKFRGLFDKSGDPIFIIKEDYIVDCNQSALNLLNYHSNLNS